LYSFRTDPIAHVIQRVRMTMVVPGPDPVFFVEGSDFRTCAEAAEVTSTSASMQQQPSAARGSAPTSGNGHGGGGTRGRKKWNVRPGAAHTSVPPSRKKKSRTDS
jgi:hypothetical protein